VVVHLRRHEQIELADRQRQDATAARFVVAQPGIAGSELAHR
jgi:hypothetical protein